jgi:hypothetical protein
MFPLLPVDGKKEASLPLQKYTHINPAGVVVPVFLSVNKSCDHVERSIVISDGRGPNATRVLGAGADATLRIVILFRTVDNVPYRRHENSGIMFEQNHGTNLRPVLQVLARVDRDAREVEERGGDEIKRSVNAHACWKTIIGFV